MKLFVGASRDGLYNIHHGGPLQNVWEDESPLSYQAQAASHYGHTLLAWSVYRNIELRQSHGSISHELTEIFGYSFSFDIAARLKSLAARYYDTTYRQLAIRLKEGKLIHATRPR